MSEQTTEQAVVRSSDGDDVMRPTKTIYDVGAFEIFWRNLWAGFSRGLGSLVVYFIFIVIVGSLFTRFVLPQLQPLLDIYSNSMNTLSTFQQYQYPANQQ